MLDAYLAKGWYRYGQSLGTCRFLMKNGKLITVVWTRLEIPGFTFRKGQRKLMRKIENRFRVEVVPERRDHPEKEELYQKYREAFKEPIAPTLNLSLYDNKTRNLFNSFEVSIYDGEELIAFSVFDVGQVAVESIKGVYHPDYKEYSLGYYTMLAEIRHCMQHDLKYYYPGYVTPGLPAFNYKLRIGELEYFDNRTGAWHDWETFDESKLDGVDMLEKLRELKEALDLRNIKNRILLNPIYEIELWKLEPHFHFGFPIYIEAYSSQFRDRSLNFVYNPDEQMYRFIPCFMMQDITRHFPSSDLPDAIPNAEELQGMVTNWRAGDSPEEAIRRMKVWMSQQMFRG